MYYHFLIHHDSDGLWAECLELNGCLTQSEKNTMEDLLENMEEALNLYLDEPAHSKTVFPEPDLTLQESESIVKVKVEPKIALANQIKRIRTKH